MNTNNSRWRTITVPTEKYTVEVIDDTEPTRFRWSRKAANTALALLMALFFAVTGLLATNQPAKAGVIDEAVRGVVCSNVYFGAQPTAPMMTPNTDDLLRNDDGTVRSGQNITAYEKYGARAGWTVWVGPDEAGELENEGEFGGRQLVNLAAGAKNIEKWGQNTDLTDAPVFFNADQSCGDPMNMGWTTAGNVIMLATGFLVHITGVTYQAIYETASSVISEMNGTIEDIVTTMTDAFYMEFFNIMVMLAALWMGYKGLVRKSSTEMATGAVWMIGAAIFGMFMLANPMLVPNAVNTTVGTVSEAAISTITNPSRATLAKSADLCVVDEGSSAASLEKPTDRAALVRSNVRTVQCAAWQQFLYTPWQLGQFGQVSGEKSENGVNYVNNAGSTPGDYGVLAKETPVLDDAPLPSSIPMGNRQVDADWALLMMDSQVSYPGADTSTQGRHMLHVASSQTFRDEPNRIWAGQSSIDRVITAATAFVAALAMAVMVVLLGFEIIMLQLLLLALVLMAPVFALVGVHPGFGRRVALLWLNTLLELAIRRIALSIWLAIWMMFLGAVMVATTNLPFALGMLLTGAVAIGGLVYKGKVLGMFQNVVNVGGAGSIQGMTDLSADNMFKKAMSGAGSAAKTVAKHGGAAAVAAGAPVAAAAVSSILNGAKGTASGGDYTSMAAHKRPGEFGDPGYQGNQDHTPDAPTTNMPGDAGRPHMDDPFVETPVGATPVVEVNGENTPDMATNDQSSATGPGDLRPEFKQLDTDHVAEDTAFVDHHPAGADVDQDVDAPQFAATTPVAEKAPVAPDAQLGDYRPAGAGVAGAGSAVAAGAVADVLGRYAGRTKVSVRAMPVSGRLAHGPRLRAGSVVGRRDAAAELLRRHRDAAGKDNTIPTAPVVRELGTDDVLTAVATRRDQDTQQAAAAVQTVQDTPVVPTGAGAAPNRAQGLPAVEDTHVVPTVLQGVPAPVGRHQGLPLVEDTPEVKLPEAPALLPVPERLTPAQWRKVDAEVGPPPVKRSYTVKDAAKNAAHGAFTGNAMGEARRARNQVAASQRDYDKANADYNRKRENAGKALLRSSQNAVKDQNRETQRAFEAQKREAQRKVDAAQKRQDDELKRQQRLADKEAEDNRRDARAVQRTALVGQEKVRTAEQVKNLRVQEQAEKADLRRQERAQKEAERAQAKAAQSSKAPKTQAPEGAQRSSALAAKPQAPAREELPITPESKPVARPTGEMKAPVEAKPLDVPAQKPKPQGAEGPKAPRVGGPKAPEVGARSQD